MPIDPSDVEMAYRAEYHQDSKYIDRKRIACATCGTSLSTKLKELNAVFTHPLLDTLQCKKCHEFYGDGDFSMDEDGSDKYCRMCGNGGELYICGKQSCLFGFCQKCISRHLGENSKEVEADDWNCLHCNSKPLWEVRAISAVIVTERSREPRKHRNKTTRSERHDDSSQSEESDSDLENTRPRSSSYRHKSENKSIHSNTLRTTRCHNKDSRKSTSRIQKSSVSRKTRESGASQKNILGQAVRSSDRHRRTRIKSDTSDDETFAFQKEQTIRRIPNTTKSIPGAFAEVDNQPAKKNNNGASTHSTQRQQNMQPSEPKIHRKKVELSESSDDLPHHSDSMSGNDSANDFVRDERKRKFKSNKGIKHLTTRKVKGYHLTNSNSKAHPSRSRSAEKIDSAVANRKTPESSMGSKCTSRESSTHSSKDSGTKSTKNEIQRNRSNNPKIDRKVEATKSRVCSNTEDVTCRTGIDRHSTDSENTYISVDKNQQTRPKVLTPNLDRGSEKAQRTKRLTTKPHNRAYLSSSSAEYDSKLLGERKASIKLCLNKFASTKDSVTKDQATAIRKHAENLMREMKMLRVGSSAGAEKIIQKHLTKDETSVAAISKMVQTCALLLIRCKEKWVRIEREFLDSYKDWCQRAEIESIFAGMDNSDATARNQVEVPVDKSMKDMVTQDLNTEKTLCNSTENSDASDYDDNCKKFNRPGYNASTPISKTSNLRRGIQENSVASHIISGNTKNPQKVNGSTRDLGNKDSDGESITSRNDDLSECDSNEIFSEDENRGRTGTTTKPVNENSNGKSSTSNAFESDSNEGEKVVEDNVEASGEVSVQIGKLNSHPSNLSDNDQQVNQASKELSRVQGSTTNTDQLDSSRDIFDDDPNNDSKTSSKNDQCSPNATNFVENIPVANELSDISETDIVDQGRDKDPDEAGTADSSPSAETDCVVDDRSACDRATILDHSKSDNSTTLSEARNINKSLELTPSADNTKETEYLSAEEMDSFEIPLQTHVTSDKQSSSKNTFVSAKSCSDLHKGAINPDRDIGLEAVSEASEVCNERKKIEKDISHSTALSNRDVKTKSFQSIGSVGENNTIEAEKNAKKASSDEAGSNSEAEIDKESSVSNSEETVKKKILESDSESSEIEKENSVSNSEETVKKKILESDPESSEIEKENSVSNSEETVKKKILESDPESSEIEKENSVPNSEETVKKKILESDPESSEIEKENSVSDLEETIKKKILESDSESSEIERENSVSDSEEAIKKKILLSDPESSDGSSEFPFQSDSFKLKLTSSSDEHSSKQTPAETGIAAITTSDMSNVGKESRSLENGENKLKTNSLSPGSVDVAEDDISMRNNLAKQRLLSESDSSGSNKMMLNSARNSIRRKSDSTSSQSNDETSAGSTSKMETASILSSKFKKRKFNLARNKYYKTDEQLQMDCKVVVRRLKEKDLEPFTQLLSKSRERQELQNFKSLVNVDNIKKRKKGSKAEKQSESGSESSVSETSVMGHAKKKKSQKVQEKEETLLDHFEKMKNGDNYCNFSGDEVDEDNVVLENVLPGAAAEKEIIMQSNQVAKAKLMESSDSENDMRTSIGNDDEQEQEEETKVKAATKKTKKKDIGKDKVADADGSHENGSNTEKDNDDTANIEEDADSGDSDRTREKKKLKKGLAARNWRLTDSDSSSQERKWNKSQESKGEEKSIELKEIGSKNKKKVKRRVLGSDSDSVKPTDLSDESAEEKDKKKKSSDSEDSSEIFENLRKKKRKKRNAGSETTSGSGHEAKSSKLKRKRIKKMDSDSDSDSDNPTNSQDTPGKLQRKNIRKVLKDKQVADVTKIAGKEEEERLKRIAERQKLYNEMYEMKLATETKVDKLILDFDEETKKELISVHEGLVKRLKPHQAQGIKFMWDACFESLAQIKSTPGSGCIVAHCMGLGKTFQVVTLAHTLLTHAETGVKTIMVVCPLSTVLNWVNEFKKWLSDINNDEDVEVFEMTKMKKNLERKYQLERWQRAGGVMVLGYEMFRLLSNQKGKKMRKSLHDAILKCLVNPGPDLIVCDEGHLLKNEDTALSKAMRQVKTMRRIVLTGTPLQNNLVEYHCMVQFVKPNLLGTKKEFLNRFVNPITNGQFGDSTEYDVKLMKKRAHVLHKMLEGSVQRFDYSVLTPFLPPKQEYVITVRLADIQIKLYQYYLDNLAKKHAGAGTSLFADFQSLQRIWTHPIVLRMNAEKVEKANEKKRMDMDTSDTEGSLKDFLDDGSSEKSTTSADSDIQSTDGSSDDKPSKRRRGTRANPVDAATFKLEDEEVPQAGEWWNQFVEPEHFEDLRISSKLVLLFAILKEAEQIGDKVLVFSQSLYALSLIEEFLSKIDDATQSGTCNELIDYQSGSWSLGLDYFRLDGQTPPENRSQYCRIFNNPKNSRARLFLISTRAGGLGINLTAANRVIIFDASWNPSHDVQSIFRIYRFGQKKPCYVYRFLAQGTMEEKIYNRQVTKLSLSCRVVDEQQIDRHYSNHDLAELYQFDPNTSADKPTLNLPKDRLLAEIFRKYEDRIETFHEHDSLLENKAEEELDEEERKEAWKEYEDERTGRRTYMNNLPNQNFAMQQYNDMLNMNQADIVNRAMLSGINMETLQNLIRQDYPNSTPEQQKMMTQRAIIEMYTYMERQSMRQQQMAAVAANNFTYPTVSNVGAASFTDKTAVSQGQQQYALQQQQQLHQILAQRDAQANYAKRFGNVRGPALSTASARQQPPQVVQIDDNDVMEVPVTSPVTTMPVPSSSAQIPAVPAPGGNSKRQEE